MIKPEIPNMPGMASMADAFEFMRKMWGGMSTPTGLPGMVMPTLSVDEINKQIADLKAVEAWLNVNMNMLRGTIQALEVQSATLSALQTMGQNFTAAMTPEKPAKKERPSATAESRVDSRIDPRIDPIKHPQAAKPGSDSAGNAGGKDKRAAKAKPDLAKDFMQPMANPAAWWNMLQTQFNQAVGSAVDAKRPEAKPAAPASATRKRKAPPPAA